MDTLHMANILKLTIASSAKMKTRVKTLDNKLYQEKYLERSIPIVWDWQVIQSEKVVFSWNSN